MFGPGPTDGLVSVWWSGIPKPNGSIGYGFVMWALDWKGKMINYIFKVSKGNIRILRLKKLCAGLMWFFRNIVL